MLVLTTTIVGAIFLGCLMLRPAPEREEQEEPKPEPPPEPRNFTSAQLLVNMAADALNRLFRGILSALSYD